MRTRLFGPAVAALLGAAAVATAQAPALPPMPVVPPAPAALAGQPPAGMTPVPAQPAPVSAHPAPAAPIVVPAQPGCGTPAPVAGCGTGKSKGGLLDRLLIGCGTANPIGCGTLASERSFAFGSCRSFYNPCRSCSGMPIEYGPGGLYNKDNCKHLTSFNNR